MSHYRCGLCGLLRGTRTYDPESFDNEIHLVEMMSLGRGKGFKVAGESPLEDDPEILLLIRNRIAVLHQHYNTQDKTDKDNLLGIIKELRNKLSTFERDLNAAKSRIGELEEEGLDTEEELLDEINEALEDVYKESFDNLPSAVEALIGEYQDIIEETEDII